MSSCQPGRNATLKQRLDTDLGNVTDKIIMIHILAQDRDGISDEESEESDESSSTCLMRCAETFAAVCVGKLVEWYVVVEVWILVELLAASSTCAVAILITSKGVVHLASVASLPYPLLSSPAPVFRSLLTLFALLPALVPLHSAYLALCPLDCLPMSALPLALLALLFCSVCPLAR